MKFVKYAVAAVATLVVALGAVPANAATAPSTTASIAAVKASLAQAKNTASSWKELSVDQTEHVVAQHASSLHTSSGLSLDVGGATAWKISGTQMLLQVPIASGQGVLAPSALTVVLDAASQSILSTAETTFTPIDQNSGVVKAWSNGEKQLDTRVIAAGVSQGTGMVSPQAAVGSGDWWNTLNACLAAQGVPAWVLTAVTAICTGACALTAGIGCILCIAAAAGFGSGVVTYCITAANNA